MRFGHLRKKRPPSKLKMLPHTPSRWTGTIGTSRPSTIFSSPPLNGSRLPVRLMAPSAKMQTISPCFSFSRACRIEFDDGPRHGNGVHQAEEPAQRFGIIIRAPYHEADEARDRSSDQQTVDMRDVIGDQQRGSARGNIRRAPDADPVERMGEHPEDEANQEIRYLADDVDRARQCRLRRKSEPACRRRDAGVRGAAIESPMRAALRWCCRNYWWR